MAAAKTPAEKPVEPAVAAEADPRLAALANLTGAAPEIPAVAPAEAEAEIGAEQILDFGGRSLARVLTTRYNQKVDGVFTQARKGDTIKTTAERLARGVAIGALAAVKK